ncbi:MAG: DUF116 domain-containing protein [Pseudomonadota bacterium]
MKKHSPSKNILTKNPFSLPRHEYQGGRKRLFIGLMTVTALALSLMLFLGWAISFIGLGNMHIWVPMVTGALLAACIGVITWAALGVVLHVYTGKAALGSDRIRALTIKFFLPLMELLGRAFGYDKKDVRHSFIKVNNELIFHHANAFSPQNVLILLPHCIQASACPIRLTYDVNLCQRCGKCPLAGLLVLRDQYGVKLAVATGGTIARRIVVKERPKLILAVACERDLASGIQDTDPIFVYGVLNDRPNGPCMDTTVSLERMEAALQHFLR